MAIIVSEKIYIGYQKRTEGKDWNTPKEERKDVLLGFATYYEENTAFENRKNTIDQWSRPRYGDVVEIPSEIINNELLSGFKLSREVRRTASWGGGNVVWRIEDPRGFELEISSANLAAIMGCSTIINGEIQCKCKWGWNTVGGSKVVLLPEHSDPYKQALKDTKRRNSNVSWKDVDIGDTVELKNGKLVTYWGYHHYLKTEYVNPSTHGYDSYLHYRLNPKTWIASKRKNHFFWLPEEDRLLMISSPKVATIVKKAEMPTTNEHVAVVVNQMIQNRYKVNTLSIENEDVNFVSPTPIKESDWKIITQPIDFETFKKHINTKIDYRGPLNEDYYNISLTIDNQFFVIKSLKKKDGIIVVEQLDKEKLFIDKKRENLVIKRDISLDERFSFGVQRRAFKYQAVEKEIDIKFAATTKIEKIMIEHDNQQYPIKM